MNKIWRNIAFWFALIVLWESIARAHVWPVYLFPSLSEVIRVLLGEVADGTLLRAVAVSMKRIVQGYGFSLVVGISLGLALARLRLLEETLGPILLGLRSLPSICWVPLGMLWFGLSEKAIHKRWRQERATDISAGGKHHGRVRNQQFHKSYAAFRATVHCHRDEAGMGFCLALVDGR